MGKKVVRPEWVPKQAGSEFATQVVPPKVSESKYRQLASKKTKEYNIAEYLQGIRSGNKALLARAITLIESNAEKHFTIAQELIKEVLPYTGKSIRIAITGMPGAGKSTFIETFGLFLIENGHRPAVLAIDPSSTISHGSILGDKTRMENLARQDKAFIRPSPSSCNLGGVARKTRETLLLCEAAGYDVILIETVGVGQSEVTVRSMVDFFLLVLISGAGDELQGIKKGIIELSDAILINKCDGENVISAEAAASQYNNALHYLANATQGWQTTAHTCSAMENKGIDRIWKVITEFMAYTKKVGIFQERRREQVAEWFESMLIEEIVSGFYRKEGVGERLAEVREAVLRGEITPIVGVKKLIGLP